MSLSSPKKHLIYIFGTFAFFLFTIADTIIKLIGDLYKDTVIFSIASFSAVIPVLIYLLYRKSFQEIKTSLQKADESIVVDIYPSGEVPIPGVSSKNLDGENIKYIKSMRAVPSYLINRVSSGDTILTIGAGDITLLGPQVLKYLDEKK